MACRALLQRPLAPAPCAAVAWRHAPLSPRRRDHRRVLRARPRGRPLGGAPGGGEQPELLPRRAGHALVAARREHGRDDLRDRHAQPRHRSRPGERGRGQLGVVGVLADGDAHRLRLRAALAPDRRRHGHRVLRAALRRTGGGVPPGLPRPVPRARLQRLRDGWCEPRGHQARWRAARLGRLGDPHGGGRRDPGLQRPRRPPRRHPHRLRPVHPRHGGLGRGGGRPREPRGRRGARRAARAPPRRGQARDDPGHERERGLGPAPAHPLAVVAAYYRAPSRGGGYVAQRMLSARSEGHAVGATLLYNGHYASGPP